MSKSPSPALPPDVIPGQLSLRAYFVAHAPAIPDWFEPVLPEVKWPETLHPHASATPTINKAVSENWSIEHANNMTRDWHPQDRVQLLSHLQLTELARQQEEKNAKIEPLERVLQWPLYWADAMIERLSK